LRLRLGVGRADHDRRLPENSGRAWVLADGGEGLVQRAALLDLQAQVHVSPEDMIGDVG
jgi:hypothetical protein